MSRGTASTPIFGDTGQDETGQIAEADTSAWEELRADGEIQFEPVIFPEKEAEPPGWLDNLLRWLADNIALGEAFVGMWPIIKWVLIALLIAAVLMLLIRLLDIPILRRSKAEADAEAAGAWTPDQDQSLALLEDADRLAAAGKYDEATHLLLKRSVGQMAEARPDWVEPSSTARELAALSDLPEAAREAFGVIAERVERSLFALRNLEQSDWEAARSAYARFALAPIRRQAI